MLNTNHLDLDKLKLCVRLVSSEDFVSWIEAGHKLS